MNKNIIISIFKTLYRIIPYILAALGGGTVAAACAGCKVGSLISIVP